MNDNQFENEELKNKDDSDVHEKQENKENENDEKKQENSQEPDNQNEDKEDKKPSDEEQKQDDKHNPFNNKRDDEKRRVVGKAVKVNFNFKGLLMLIFIITLAFVVPSMMDESASEKTNDISYSTFIKNIEDKNINVIEERDGYIYGYKEDPAKLNQVTQNKSGGLKAKLGIKTEEEVQGFKARLITNRLGEDANLMTVINNNSAIIRSIDPP